MSNISNDSERQQLTASTSELLSDQTATPVSVSAINTVTATTSERFNNLFSSIMNNQESLLSNSNSSAVLVGAGGANGDANLATQRLLRAHLLHSHSGSVDETAAVDQSIADSQDIVLNLTSNNDATNGDAPPGHAHQQQPQNVFNLALMSLQTNVPIILILLAKVFHQHLFGFFVILAFIGTLHWCNNCLVRQIELKEKRNCTKATLLLLFVLCNLSIFFIVFSEYQIQYALVFMSTNIKQMDIWHLVWLVICCDTIIKLIAIGLKSLLILTPFTIIPLRKRGNYYSVIEVVASFYRLLIPVHPWIVFLLKPNDLTNTPIDVQNDSSIFPAILCVLYILFKLNHIYNSYTELSEVIVNVYNEQMYGVPVNKVEIEDTAVCPICQDKYTHPIKLKCKHIFCHDCVCVWLDREQTCPMCRAKILTKRPSYRDGSTTYMVQWY